MKRGALRTRLSLVVALLAITSTCGGDPPSDPGDNGGPPSGSVGTLDVRVTSTGEDIPDSYELVLDESPPQPVSANGSERFADLLPGSHTAELVDVPANCDAMTENPVSVTVIASETATAEFSVTCILTGPDFERELGPGEYQVSVTGDVQRSFETTGATLYDYQNPPGPSRTTLFMWDNSGALDGAEFDICPAPFEPTTYAFDAVTESTDCQPDPARVTGGLIVQLGAPQ